jgi:hypothetical protein
MTDQGIDLIAMDLEGAEVSLHDAASLRAMLKEAILRVTDRRRREGDPTYSLAVVRNQISRMREVRTAELSQDNLLDDEIVLILDILSELTALKNCTF